MTKGVKTIAALMEDEDRGDRLLDATRKLCGAVTDLLGSVNPERLQVSYLALLVGSSREHHALIVFKAATGGAAFSAA